MSKAKELLEAVRDCEEKHIIFNLHNKFSLSDIDQVIAELEKPITEYPDVQRLIIQVEKLQAENKLIKGFIRMALDELGVPNEDYPAPVSNAVDFLNQALKGGQRKDSAETPQGGEPPILKG